MLDFFFSGLKIFSYINFLILFNAVILISYKKVKIINNYKNYEIYLIILNFSLSLCLDQNYKAFFFKLIFFFNIFSYRYPNYLIKLDNIDGYMQASKLPVF